MAKIAHMLEKKMQLKGVSAKVKEDVDKMLGRPCFSPVLVKSSKSLATAEGCGLRVCL